MSTVALTRTENTNRSYIGIRSRLRHNENQGRIIHCAGCTMAGGPVARGPPADQLPNFYHAVLTFERSVLRLNVTTTKKRSSTFLGKIKCTATDKKILASRTRKGPPPYVGRGPRMVNPSLTKTHLLNK